MAAVCAAQDVDVLVVIRAGKMRGTDNDLPVAVPVACLGRPFAHSGQYTYPRSGALDPGSLKATLESLQADALPFPLLSPIWRSSRC